MKISQIRPEHLGELAHKAYSKDLLFYMAKQHLFLERACPACEVLNKSIFLTKDNFNYSKCKSCGCVYMNPGPTNDLVNQFYETSENYKFWAEYMYPQSRIERLQTIHRERADWVIDYLSTKSPNQEQFMVLELGAGTGDTLTSITKDKSLQFVGFATEPNPSMEAHLESNGVHVLKPSQLASADYFEKFDAVVCFEVLEHLLRPSDFLKSVYSNLKSGGHLFASTPNAQSLEVQMLKGESTTIDIEHISLLTSASIHALAHSNSFQVLEISTPGSFDLELIQKSKSNVSIVNGSEVLADAEVQRFIGESGFSSHMKCILTRK